MQHLDVGEHQRDVRSAFEDCDGFVSIHRLDRRIAGIFHHIDRAHPQQHFVFDDENDCGNNGVIEGHYGGRFRRKAGNQLASQRRMAANTETSISSPI